MNRIIGVAAAAILTSACLAGAQSASGAPARAHHFQNCTDMHRVYKHGVGRLHAHDHTSGTPVTNFKRSNKLYAANKGSDRDGDRIACEAN